MAVLIGIAVVAMLGGAIFYNKLRASVYGIIGVGGSYFATIGIMVLVMLISSLFAGSTGASAMETVLYIIFMLAGLGYLAYVMIVRCQTTTQRVLLPLIAVLIAFGFCWRFIMALVFKIPMGNGAPAQAAAKFPASLTDNQGELWRLQSDSGDHAEYYCPKTGGTTTIWYTGDYAAIPNGWRIN